MQQQNSGDEINGNYKGIGSSANLKQLLLPLMAGHSRATLWMAKGLVCVCMCMCVCVYVYVCVCVCVCVCGV